MYGENGKIERVGGVPAEEINDLENEPAQADQPAFDPQEELAKVMAAPRSERVDLLTDFKERLREHVEGLAEVQEDVITAIRKTPDAPADNIVGMVESLGARYGMSDKQKEMARQLVSAYEDKHNKIKEISEKNPDDRSLFQALFGRLPEGKVEIVKGPMTLYVRCESLEDYATIHSQRFLRHQDAGPEDKETAKRSGGVSISTSLIPGLEGTIIAEKSGWLGYRVKGFVGSDDVHRHEEQHAIRAMFEDHTHHKMVIDELYEAKTKEGKELALKVLMRFGREKMDYQASNEILAYSTSPISQKELLKTLTQSASKKGLYEYFGKEERSHTRNWVVKQLPDDFKDGIEDFDPWLDKVMDEIYVTEYRNLIKTGIASFNKLTGTGYSRGKAISVLTHEPLVRWKKTTDRLLGTNK